MACCADIAIVFPGLFNIEQLLDLDLDDFGWWHAEAVKRSQHG